MGLPVTSGDPFEGETLDGLAGIPVCFGDCRGGWNGSYDPLPPSSLRTDIGFLNGADLNYGLLVRPFRRLQHCER